MTKFLVSSIFGFSAWKCGVVVTEVVVVEARFGVVVLAPTTSVKMAKKRESVSSRGAAAVTRAPTASWPG
ncbi:hypothetical protein [Streptomyces mirabilis]|uniref:hypothetical protein n=1 Tax=Streptomyces mirabilis TaxID=68239 RepID=UPI00364D8E3A